MNGFTQTHYLRDMLENKKFASILPQFRVKETHEGTKISVTSKSLYKMVYQYAKDGARGHYKPLETKMGGMVIQIGGTLITSLDEAFDSVYRSIKTKTTMLNMIANNRDILRSALKYSETQMLRKGERPMLYLKEGVYQNIESLNPNAQRQFLQDVLDNIRYSDQFAKIQKQYGIDQEHDSMYEIKKYQWQQKVGELIWAKNRGEEFTEWNRRTMK